MSTFKQVIVAVVAILVIGAAWFFTDRKSDVAPIVSSTPTTTPISIPSTTRSIPMSSLANGKSIDSITSKSMHTVTIQTTKGTIVFETYDLDAPKTVANFITLANKGFYNGTIFHRVIPGFMIQGGDPTGTGMGGPGYKFADELDPNTPSAQAGYVQGIVAMANSGPDTNGSQFFIMHKDYPLPHNYTIFGKVISGQDVVDAIANTPRDKSDKPLTKVVMEKVTVADKAQ